MKRRLLLSPMVLHTTVDSRIGTDAAIRHTRRAVVGVVVVALVNALVPSGYTNLAGALSGSFTGSAFLAANPWSLHSAGMEGGPIAVSPAYAADHTLLVATRVGGGRLAGLCHGPHRVGWNGAPRHFPLHRWWRLLDSGREWSADPAQLPCAARPIADLYQRPYAI